MIIGLEIGLLIFGLLAVFRGRMTISSTRVVEGIPARLLGLLAMAPFPTSVMLVVIITVASGTPDPIQFGKDNYLAFTLMEGGLPSSRGLSLSSRGISLERTPANQDRRKRNAFPLNGNSMMKLMRKRNYRKSVRVGRLGEKSNSMMTNSDARQAPGIPGGISCRIFGGLGNGCCGQCNRLRNRVVGSCGFIVRRRPL